MGKRKADRTGGSKTNFDSSTSMVRTPHPAYKALIDGFDKMWEKQSAKLPGPEKVVHAIYRAATDGSARLRYPALAFPFLNIRNLVGARGWSAIMKMMVRRMRRAPVQCGAPRCPGGAMFKETSLHCRSRDNRRRPHPRRALVDTYLGGEAARGARTAVYVL